MLVGGFCHKLLCIMSFMFHRLAGYKVNKHMQLDILHFTDLNMTIFDENCVLLMVGTS